MCKTMWQKSFEQFILERNGDSVTRSGFAHVVIDVQRGFCERGFWGPEHVEGTKETERVAHHIASIMPAFRAARAQTVIIYSSPPKLDLRLSFETAFGGPYAIQKQQSDIVISKQDDGGFETSDIDSVLQTVGTRNLLVSGFNIKYCLPAFAGAAHDRGYNVAIMRDMAGQGRHFSADSIQNALDKMEQSGICVTESPAVLEFLNELNVAA
ncbi:MAG: isochorismatase family protein [Alphaproteobacteria bacterium]|nr:isochorismatase family protein [Alphaproteobacteria bacterium]